MLHENGSHTFFNSDFYTTKLVKTCNITAIYWLVKSMSSQSITVSWFPFIAQIRTSWHISGSFLDSSKIQDTITRRWRRDIVYILWWYFDNYSNPMWYCATKSQQVFMSDDYLVMDQIHETWVSGFKSAIEKWDFKASWTRLFFIFLSNFWHIWWFCKVTQHLWSVPF